MPVITPAPSPSRASAPAGNVSRGAASAARLRTRSTVGHVTEDAACIAHNLVVTMALDVTDEPDTTHPTVSGWSWELVLRRVSGDARVGSSALGDGSHVLRSERRASLCV